MQRCWACKISGRVQLQQATAGTDPKQTWTETQTCVKSGNNQVDLGVQ